MGQKGHVHAVAVMSKNIVDAAVVEVMGAVSTVVPVVLAVVAASVGVALEGVVLKVVAVDLDEELVAVFVVSTVVVRLNVGAVAAVDEAAAVVLAVKANVVDVVDHSGVDDASVVVSAVGVATVEEEEEAAAEEEEEEEKEEAEKE